jgi:hypothetical protein
MYKKRWGKIGGVAVIGAAVLVGLHACATTTTTTLSPRPLLEGVVGVEQFEREAKEGGVVTVDAGVVPGALPDTNMSGPAETVAWFSNEGQGGKHEKRYGWKPNSDAEYYLVLSNDGSGRTKWTMNEINRATGASRPFRSGHLWGCELYHPTATTRQVGFKVCPQTIQYDSSEVSLNAGGDRLARFASYTFEPEPGDEDALTVLGPVWISCTSGCCTLGR